ncbi:MAG: sugar ABC transporter permease [Spirochaetes bacterium]|nr:sugar ABC transporter permease [Spirochaetota bacterium]
MMRGARMSLGSRLEHNEGLFAFLLVLPAMLIVIALYVYPLVFSLVVSFFRSDIRYPGVEFRGLKNYIDIFRDPDLVASFGRTIYFTVASLAIEMVVGVVVAVAFNSRFAGRPVARSIILIPWAVPPVVNGIIWNWMVHPKIGIVNYVLTAVGILDRYKPWLADPGWALNIIVMADAWKWTPLVVLLVLAGLQAIPEELYEAARMDGAGATKVFFRVTLPCVMWPLLVTLILRTVEAVRVFDIIFVMTRGGPASATKVTTFYVWEIAFRYHQLGMGSALAYTVTILIIALAVVYYRVMNRRVEF